MGDRFIGLSGQVGLRMDGLACFWTEDDVARVTQSHPIIGLNDEVMAVQTVAVGWDPATVDELTETDLDRDLGTVDRPDLLERLDHLRDMARITDAQVDAYITGNVSDLASARTYLARLTKETRDILRVALWLLKGRL